MAQQPHRPFESLEWYRDAVRNNFRDDDPHGSLSRWARGFGMLHTHICIFAAAIVVMLVINLLRTPDSIWADRWIMAWTVLVLIHAVAVGLVWAIQQWDTDSPDEALQMNLSSRWRQSAMFAGGSSGGNDDDAQDVNFRVGEATSSLNPAPASPATSQRAWSGWNADGDEETTRPSERASWKEATAAAWLDRGSHDATPPDPEAESRE